VGIGTYTSSGTTLSRDTVLSSSNGGLLVNFSAGTKDVWVDYPSGRAVFENEAGNVDGFPITGGTIDNTVIGGTTPAAGTFTTLGAQNATLRGTGNNFFPTTTTFSNFGLNGGTLTLSTATTDPFGGTSVYKLVANSGQDPNAGSSAILSGSGNILPLGVLFTQSIYFKAAELNALRIRNNSTGEIYTFTIGTTPTPTAGVQTPALTLISNGWYRASWTFVTGQIGSLGRADNWSFRLAVTGNGTSGIFVSSPQLEYGATLSVYTPNTSTSPLYGTPTLSFVGVTSVGLQSDGSLYLQPAGTGAVQAQATTSTATGGNARGANAVDWQTARGAASQVASTFSVIGGGQANTSSGYATTVSGGEFNTNAAYNGFIGAGSGNALGGSAQRSVIAGGTTNIANGFMNFIGGGAINSGTSGSAVTTQSATMNGTTAVTLSGSNASIRVGQIIQGTSINNFPYTYVAAISGTSLTLSQAASGSSTSTLSFFTPHGVVVGGGNNQATGSYSFIGGGGDAGTAGNRNVASGDWSVVGGGRGNSASGAGAVIAGGGVFSGAQNQIYPQFAGGSASFIGGGLSNNASGAFASIVGGLANIANGAGSTAIGMQATTRAITGCFAYGGCDGAVAFTSGVSQSSFIMLGRQTTDATATVLTSNTAAASTTNQVILPNNSAYAFRGTVISGVTGGGNTKGWTIEGVIKRGANAASTTLVGTPTVTSSFADAGASTWTIAVTADTTNGGLAVTFTGQAATTIRTVCRVNTVEMTF
jgi:hypothetical protein